jgi:hypothetical protein
MEILILIPFYIVSTIAIVLGTALLRKSRDLRKRGKVATAVIIENVGKTGSRTGMYYYPIVRFATESKEFVTHEMITGYNPAKPEGTEVEILYDPLDPKKAAVNSKFEMNVLPKIMIALGSLFMLIAIMMTFS